ncbi:MAG: putative glycolipid-binding domain-containing protein [Actinomycetota bacterium]|nr:putative glycolipid-binding domain-containing protein [Actinomycetota bacterium]
MATMTTWRSDDPAGPGLKAARVVLGETGFRAVGRMVRTTDDGVFSASYRLVVGASGAVERLVVDTAGEDRERQLTITRDDGGVWLADDGSGAARIDAGGALDVDLAFSPVFNALPIRRLGLHREKSEHTVPMVFVALPEVTVEVTEPTYRTVRTGTDGDLAVVGFAAGDFAAEMTVDADGMVLDYPGIALRV